MNIAIQASDLDAERIDGTRVYLKELLKRFGIVSPETDFLLYHRGIFNPILAPPELPRYEERSLSFPIAWMQTRFALEMFLRRPKKLFLPIQAAPICLPQGTEVTATIHDLAFKRYPETFPRNHLWKLNFMLDMAVKQSDKLIAVSESTKRDLLEFFPKLSPEKIRVIHHGFDDAFFSARILERELDSQLRAYDVRRGGYMLYVGALQPRKNLVRLIEAFEVAKKSVPEMKLVLAGEPAWLSEDILSARNQSQYKDDVILTGRVTFEKLRVLYQGARFFVFPSLYEGFGLPILEAFASGVPVLTAANSSLTEVAGKAALYCNAESVSDITGKLERLWDDEALRQHLIMRGEDQLRKFSWDACAQETLRYIQE